MVFGRSGSATPPRDGVGGGSLEAAIARLEAVADRLEGVAGGGGGRAGGATNAPAAAPPPPASSSADALSDWDARVGPTIAALLAAADGMDKEVKAVTAIAANALAAEREVLATIASMPSRPDQAALSALLSPITAAIGDADKAAGGRRNPAFHHAKAVGELLPGLLWPAYTPGSGAPPPAQQVDDAWQAAEFWGNKAVAEVSGSAKAAHLGWVKALKAAAGAVRDHVAATAAAGPAWGAGGGGGGGSGRPAPARGGPPPPPPPMPAGGPGCLARDAAAAPAAAKPAGGMAAVLAAIKRGDGGSGGLRKVDRKAAAAAAAAAPIPAAPARAAGAAATAAAAAVPRGPPRTVLEPGGRKWTVENYVSAPGASDPVVVTLSDATPSQAVSISACAGVTVDIPGKVNAVCIDGCDRLGVRLSDVVASVELVNGRKVGVEVTGVAPTIAVDGCVGVTLYLSAKGAACTDVTTAQASEVNIVLPAPNDAADPVELAVPEQFVSRVVKGKLVTEPVAHSGA